MTMTLPTLQLAAESLATVSPAEPKRAFKVLVDLTSSADWLIDLTLFQEQRKFRALHTVFIDLSRSVNGCILFHVDDFSMSPLFFTQQSFNWRIQQKPKTAGFFPIRTFGNPKFRVISTVAAGIVVPIIFYNFEIPPIDWNT